MKHQRLYLIIATIVKYLLPHLDFHWPWQAQIGHELLWFINALGAKWIYEWDSK